MIKMTITRSKKEAQRDLSEHEERDGWRIVKHPYRNRKYAVVPPGMTDGVVIYYMDGGQ